MLSSSAVQGAWAPRCRGPWATITLYGGGGVSVRPAIVEAVKAMDAVLRRHNYRTWSNQTGAFNCRRVKGTNSWSTHAYGVAIDINWLVNLYTSRLRTNISPSLARDITGIRTNNGRQVWNWGGYWAGKKDSMHFQIACTPGDLATGINWRTVNGTPVGNIPRPPVNKPAPGPTPTPNPQPPSFPIFNDEGDDFDMRLFRDHNGSVWILTGRERKHVATPNEYKALKGSWIPNHDIGPGSPFYNPILSQVILNYTNEVSKQQLCAIIVVMDNKLKITCAKCKWEGIFGDIACACGLEYLVFGESTLTALKKLSLPSNTFIIDPLHELGMMSYDTLATNIGVAKS